MRSERPLSPGGRAVVGDLLRAPPGARFEAAVATTYTLDIETALIAPVSLALQAAETRAEALQSPLALLEGLERSLGRLAVFCEAGRIQAAPTPTPRLAALLDGLIVETIAQGGGAFHPKLWLMRYRDSAGTALMRLLLLSRNLTRDASWDLCLALDGLVATAGDANGGPVADLVAALPDLASTRASDRLEALTAELAEDCRRTIWRPPLPFEEVSFAVNGLEGEPWQPPAGNRTAVIAPFCDPAALKALTPKRTEARLVSRPEALAELPEQLLARFARVQILDDAATTEDGEEPPSDQLTGLHAKCFLAEQGRRVAMTVGSGNATAPALLNGGNVEVFATMWGKRSAVGSIEELLGEDRLGAILTEFTGAEPTGVDPAIEAAEKRLDTARRALAAAGLTMWCGDSSDEEVTSVPVTLSLVGPMPGVDGLAVEVWPISLGEAHRREAAALCGGGRVALGSVALRDLTRFVAFRLTDQDTGRQTLFSLGAVIENMPEDRDGAVLRAIVDSRAAFLRYLQLILAEEWEDPFAAARDLVDGNGGKGRPDHENASILEPMVRALISDDARLEDVERLVRRLRARQGEDAIIPPDFLELWAAFRETMQPRGGSG